MGLPQTLLQAYEENCIYDQHGQKIPLEGSVTKEEAQLLYDVCRQLKPQSSLELGFGCGMSALAILQALEDNKKGHHTIFDYKMDVCGTAGLAMVERAGLAQRMRFYPHQIEDCSQTIPVLDFAFIDASHLFDLTLFAFVLIDKKLSQGGLIGFHDTWLPAQRQVITYILKNRAYTLYNPLKENQGGTGIKTAVRSHLLPLFVRLYPNHLQPKWNLPLPNLAILQKIGEDDRNWDFHVDFV